ncbi:MAG TPA: aspartate carbamoyltransferase catalytic subunit [Elusimicrobiota bacterium]|nr:aspartate carbamoyltransferase catalytic subunit [Elusimicrobiota bacterium]
MRLRHKDLLGLASLTPEEIELILHTAAPFKTLFTRSIKKVPTLRGKTAAMLFYEPSTRTRTSFELAATRLSADVLSLAVASSSVQKGESLIDTALNLEAMKVDFLILRHSVSGAPDLLARGIRAHVVNAGDGNHEHPTQGLLDLFTIREKRKKIQGLTVAIIGDIVHSRVARSNIWGLTKLGARVRLCGPATLIPQEMRTAFGNEVEVTYNLKDALDGADVAYVLRLQLERQQENLFPSLREYHEFYGLDAKKLAWAKKDCLVMHPGPMNRGVEIDSSVADGPQSVILDQVTNGIAVRMAVLYLLAGSGNESAGNSPGAEAPAESHEASRRIS